MVRPIHIVACLLVGLAATAPLAAAGGPRIDVIAHPSCGKQSLTRDELIAVLSRSQTTWGTGKRVVVLNLAPGSPVRVAVDKAVLGMDRDQMATYWIEKRIRGHGAAPRVVPNVRLLAKVITRLPGSIGYLPHQGPIGGVITVGHIEQGKYHPGGK